MNREVKMYNRQLVKNKHHISIAKCCLSCVHMSYKTAIKRYCRVGCGEINGAGYCAAYRMKDIYHDVGKNPNGGVHTKHYLTWILDRRIEEADNKLVPVGIDVPDGLVNVPETGTLRTQSVVQFVSQLVAPTVIECNDVQL